MADEAMSLCGFKSYYHIILREYVKRTSFERKKQLA